MQTVETEVCSIYASKWAAAFVRPEVWSVDLIYSGVSWVWSFVVVMVTFSVPHALNSLEIVVALSLG